MQEEWECPYCGTKETEDTYYGHYQDDDFISIEWECICASCHKKYRVYETYRLENREIVSAE